MRKSTSIKLFALAGAGICGTWLTSTVIGQQQLRKTVATRPAEVPAKANTEVGVRTVITNRALSPAEVAAIANHEIDPDAQLVEKLELQAKLRAKPGPSAQFVMKGMDVQATGNDVSVFVRAWMYDTRADSRFRWTLRVFDAKRKTRFVEKNYDEQIFPLVPGEVGDPTFNETVKLQPGEYSVEVIVHAFQVGFDTDTLNDKDVEKSHRVLSNIKKVSVGP